jgi:citrate synthase
MWKSSISKIEPNHIVTRGYRQEDLIGNVPFASVFFLLLKGRMPREREARMIDAILTSSVDHGTTPPTTHASRIVASAGVPLPAAVAAGILAVGDVHGGAIEDGARIMQEWAKKIKGEHWTPEKAAQALLAKLKKERKYMPGFGHRIHTQDPRTKKLFALADKLRISKDCVKLTRAIENEFTKDKPLPVNVDGAIAAVISDMDFDWRLGKAFFLIGRVAGLIAHVFEEMTREKPMRRMCDSEVEYDGPWEREMAEKKGRREAGVKRIKKTRKTKI